MITSLSRATYPVNTLKIRFGKTRLFKPHVGDVVLQRRIVKPESYTRIIGKIKDIPKWRVINRRLAEYTEQAGGFFFVQIGANDGKSVDPIRQHVLKYKWSGLLVEPVPHVFRRLKQNYAGQRGLSFANVAVSDHDGNATMLAAVELPGGEPNPFSLISSFSPEVIQKHLWMASDPDGLIRPTEVRTVTLSTLFDRFGVDHVDGLFIDTEGHDGKILDQLDLAATRPRFVLYEHGHLPKSHQTELTRRFKQAGYVLTTLRRDTFAELRE